MGATSGSPFTVSSTTALSSVILSSGVSSAFSSLASDSLIVADGVVESTVSSPSAVFWLIIIASSFSCVSTSFESIAIPVNHSPNYIIKKSLKIDCLFVETIFKNLINFDSLI